MAGPNIKERLGLDELKRGIWKALLAEFLGNLLLNYFGCGSCIWVHHQTYSGPVTGEGDTVVIALSFGLAIMAIVQGIGHISGAHVNPAVTCGMLVTGNISILKGVLYIIVQCLGAIAGTGILKALTPDHAQNKLGATGLGHGVTPVQGFGVEFILGFILLFVIFGVCDTYRPEGKGMVAVTIGLTIALGHLVSLDYTGSSMNPARSLGSAVLSNFWDHHWVYWLGPILGAICASLLYKHVFSALPTIETTTEYSPVQVQDKELKRLDNKKDEDGMA